MPDLAQSLGGHDLGYLHIVAEFWGISFEAAEFQQGVEDLVPLLIEPQHVAEVVASLPAEAQDALDDLQRNAGRLPWSLFTRRYGLIREMGPGRRDRTQPYLDPISSAEVLYYRALVGRSFFDSAGGPEEYAFIPDDLSAILTRDRVAVEPTLGSTALSAQRAHLLLASDRILDDACTMLAALRLGVPEDEVPLSPFPGPFPLTPVTLKKLLRAAGLLDESDLPKSKPTRVFLESTRGEALAQLDLAWQNSESFNDLALIPGLVLEGEWTNDPLTTRGAIMDFIGTIEQGTWWNLASFVAAIHQEYPDYQRPAGDYDSWFIRHDESGEYLRGFEHWDQVDGQLISFIITGPLHWLGIVDLAAPAEDKPITAFRTSRWSPDLLGGQAPKGIPAEEGKIQIRSDASLHLSTNIPRSVRYQIARFCQWEGFEGNSFRYRITPHSLERARNQDLHTNQLLTLIRKNTELIPPNLVKALERWQEHGSQARMARVVVLRVGSAEILEELRASKAARFLGDPLGPTVVIVKPGARDKVLKALAEMGYLGEIVGEK
jgi:hypothetical protein